MKYRRIDDKGDYVFGNGINDYKKDIDAFKQACITKPKLLVGEWWEDLREGLPLYEDVFAQFISSDEELHLINNVFLNKITEIQGFSGFNKNEATLNNEARKYTLNVDVSTIWGDIRNLELV